MQIIPMESEKCILNAINDVKITIDKMRTEDLPQNIEEVYSRIINEITTIATCGLFKFNARLTITNNHRSVFIIGLGNYEFEFSNDGLKVFMGFTPEPILSMDLRWTNKKRHTEYIQLAKMLYGILTEQIATFRPVDPIVLSQFVQRFPELIISK